MRKFFKWLWAEIRSLPKKIWNLLKQRPLLFFGIVFVWAVPIILLSEQFVFAKKVPAGIKLTIVGVLILIFLFFALSKRLFAMTKNMKDPLHKTLILTLFRTLTYGIVFAVIYMLMIVSDKIHNWWILVGISWLVGSVLYILDSIKERRKLNGEIENNETNS